MFNHFPEFQEGFEPIKPSCVRPLLISSIGPQKVDFGLIPLITEFTEYYRHANILLKLVAFIWMKL